MWELFIELPAWYQYSMVFVLGCILGSFLDVFTLRFHTGRSINGRSHCLSCGQTLSWYELIPVISYLTQKGRCRVCGAYIPMRLLFMELTLGALFLFTFVYSTSFIDLFLSLLLVLFLVVVAVYDGRHLIIPNGLTIAITALALVIVLVDLKSVSQVLTYWPAVASAFACFGFYAGLWLVSKGKWIGFGDAKLAIPLGFLLGPMGSFSFIVFSFWIGALVSLFLLGLQKLSMRGQKRLSFISLPLTMKSEVPFAPFMIAAFLLVYLTGADVLRLLSQLFYGM